MVRVGAVPCCLQEHAASLAADLASSQKEQQRLRAEVAAAVQDAREAIGRETDIYEQLQRANEVISLDKYSILDTAVFLEMMNACVEVPVGMAESDIGNNYLHHSDGISKCMFLHKLTLGFLPGSISSQSLLPCFYDLFQTGSAATSSVQLGA